MTEPIDDDPQTEQPDEDQPARADHTISKTLAVIGGLAAIGIAGWIIWTIRTADKTLGGANAIQLTQLYTEGTFWLILIAVIILAAQAIERQ